MRFTSDLGIALHTALRKCCDSSPTSAAWNLINVLEEPWKDLLKVIREGFKGFKFDRKSTKSKNDQLAAHLKLVVTRQWEPWGKGYVAVALHCVFETFSANDWYGFASFLDGVIVKPAPKKKAAAA